MEGIPDVETVVRDACKPLPTSSGKPLVTIVVPTYKRPDLLSECLAAIQVQTLPNFVVHVCDNSSEQEGRAVVEALQDSRFRYFPRGRNIGMLNNVLQAFQEASTNYVMEVDDDDILYPHGLYLLLQPFVNNPHLTIVFGDLDVVDHVRRVMPLQERVRYLPSLEFLSEGIQQPFTGLAAHGYVFLMASMLRRNYIDWKAVPESSATAYDRYLTLAASRNDAAGYFVSDAVMAYRIHERSDGLRFTIRCLSGALDVLIREIPLSTPASRKLIDLEIVRTRIRLSRAYRGAGEQRAAHDQLRRLITPSGLRALAYMSIWQYLPQRLRLARDVARMRNHGVVTTT